MEQVVKSLHLPFHFLNPVAIEYAKKLVECTLKAEKSFTNSYGSDRNDIKIN